MISAVFLDRDGTINHDSGYVHRVADLRLLDGALVGLQLLRDLGYHLFIVSNQAGIARGYFTEEDAQACNAGLCRLLAENGVVIAGVYYCPHHPTHGIGTYRQESEDRKPRPGMLLRAAREHRIDLTKSYMIGDKKSDILAGQAADCRSILVLTGEAGRGEPELHAEPDHTANNLLDAARIIQSHAHEPQSRR